LITGNQVHYEQEYRLSCNFCFVHKIRTVPTPSIWSIGSATGRSMTSIPPKPLTPFKRFLQEHWEGPENEATRKRFKQRSSTETASWRASFTKHCVDHVPNDTASTDALAALLRSSVDWERYFDSVCGIGTQLNTPTERFDKGTFNEEVLAAVSNGVLEWVNSEGHDLCVPKFESGATIELKTEVGKDHTTKGIPKQLVHRTIKNTLGGGLQNTADFYIFANECEALLVSFQHLRPFIVRANSDQWKASIPRTHMKSLWASTIQRSHLHNALPYARLKAQFRQDLIKLVPSRPLPALALWIAAGFTAEAWAALPSDGRAPWLAKARREDGLYQSRLRRLTDQGAHHAD